MSEKYDSPLLRFASMHRWDDASDGVKWAHKLVSGELTSFDVAIPMQHGFLEEWHRAMIDELVRLAQT
jgi:hypothetical protein